MPQKTGNRFKKRPPQKKAKPGGRRRWLLPAGLLLLVLASLAATVYFVFLRTRAPRTGPAPRPPRVVERPAGTLPTAPPQEQPTPAELPPATPVVPPPPEPPAAVAPGVVPGKTAKLAIIIDDMGFRRETGDRLLALDLNLTFSFLPDGPHTTELAQKAGRLRRDILLHLPLEPDDPKWNPGPGTLTVAMSGEKMRAAFNQALATVPKAIGVNNHMGSRFTADPRAMGTLLTLLRDHNLFFIDSITTPKSTGSSLAVAMGVKTARRHIFLDNDQNKEKISAHLNALVELAQNHGQAVGIGHPYPVTLAALRDFQNTLPAGVTVVGIHEMIY